MDDFDARFNAARNRPPSPHDPVRPLIPRVVVRREWPYFDEDEDLDSLESVTRRLDSLWYKLTDTATGLDDVKFYGDTSEYQLDGRTIDPESEHHPDARIAIANFQYMEDQWQELLLHPSWNQPTRDKHIYHKEWTETVQEPFVVYPPANVMAELFREQVPFPVEAIHYLMFEKNVKKAHLDAMELMEHCRRTGIAIVRPTMALFFASLTAKGLRLAPPTAPVKRCDEPDDAQTEQGRRVLESMGVTNPKVEAFRAACRLAGFKGSNELLSKVLKRLRPSAPSPPSPPSPRDE